MPAMLNTDAKAIALCVTVFAAGAALLTLGLVLDPMVHLRDIFTK